VRSAVSQLSARIAATLRTYAVDVSLGGDERDRALPQHLSAAVFAPIWFHGWLGDASTQFRIALVTAAVLSLTQAPRTAIERLAGSLAAAGRQ
jgi:hypothetical protein